MKKSMEQDEKQHVEQGREKDIDREHLGEHHLEQELEERPRRLR